MKNNQISASREFEPRKITHPKKNINLKSGLAAEYASQFFSTDNE
jgi:hypothetical protein